MVLTTALVVVLAVMIGSAGSEKKRAPKGPRESAPASVVLSARV
jgi:hypothetical protein